MLDRLTHSADAKVRDRAIAGLSRSAAVRAVRAFAQEIPGMMAVPSPAASKNRLVYDAKGKDSFPGKLVRSEGQKKSADVAVNEAFDHCGDTYDFYRELFERNALDGSGMTLISTVHVGEPDQAGKFQPMDNAFWDGAQMAYGDGDGVVFQRFTRSLDVVAHELTHGVQSFTSNLVYRGQSGALNEHFSDVFGVLVRQWKLGEKADKASWLIGADVLVPAKTRRAIRDMENPGTAYVDDPDLGTDPQPAHMKDFYTGAADNGGVHLNSGIPTGPSRSSPGSWAASPGKRRGGSGTTRCFSFRAAASLSTSKRLPRRSLPTTSASARRPRKSWPRPGRRWGCKWQMRNRPVRR